VCRYGSGLIIYWQGFVETIPQIIASRYITGTGVGGGSSAVSGQSTSAGSSNGSSASGSGANGSPQAMIYVSDHFPLRWIDPTGVETVLR
jgi:hypothetical protein